MRTFLQKIFRPFFVWIAEKFSDAPDRDLVLRSLTNLFRAISDNKTWKGIVIDIYPLKDSYIIFSDQHKGNKDNGDDFKTNELNYINALKYYYENGYSYINLGDAEELWKYKVTDVLPQYKEVLKAEANFHNEKKYYRTFGNHDLLWKNPLDVMMHLKDHFSMPLKIYEGIILKMNVGKPLNIFLTHGHQGDKMSDNNIVSTWIIAHIWTPIQRYLEINVNTPAKDFSLRDKHNRLMYEWSSHKRNTILITGHTHKPVFASGRYSTTPDHKINVNADKPSYFNTGCCCFSDGDITGIEIDKGFIRLIKWQNINSFSERIILEEKKLSDILNDM